MATLPFSPEEETQREGETELVVEKPTTEAHTTKDVEPQSGFGSYLVGRWRDLLFPIEQKLQDYVQHFDELKNTVQTIWEFCGPDGQLLEQVSEVKSEVKTLKEQSNEMKEDIKAQLHDLSTASEENSERCEKNAAGVKDVSERYTQMEQRMDEEKAELTHTCDCLQQSVKDTQIQLQELTTTSKERYNEGATRCDKLERQMDELHEEFSDKQVKKPTDPNQANDVGPSLESQMKWLQSQLDDQRKRLDACVANQEMLQATTAQVAQQAVEAHTVENLGTEQPGQTKDARQ